ncbi:site-specific integrase [Rhizobium leguminosarum]|uniref:hypothetical protein n=1 Tax=Rhizobium leguminosarum TaxID=384 RepID=UPI001C939582|nr:hypothetical protein [Rhizobium leguminosarum]MBY5505339.1 site-specific integrase [Rhizobium leguminosarum]
MQTFVETKVEFLASILSKGSSGVSKQAVCYNPREGLILPVNAFLFDRRFNQGKSWRTVEADARSLCQWWDFLYLKGMDFRRADVDDLRDFILSGGTRYGNVVRLPGVDPHVNFNETTAAKADTILSFYKFLQNGCDVRLEGGPGETLGDVRRRTLGRVRYHEQETQDEEQPTFAYPRSENPRLRYLRPTPTPEEATEIIKATAKAHRPFHVHSYYFIASLFRFGGLRAGGCESLTLSGFFGAMAVETAFMKVGLAAALRNGQRLNNSQFEIVECLNKMLRQGRTYLFVPVIEKGSIQRLAPIPIKIAIELVDYILNERRRFIEQKRQKYPYDPPDNVFLSSKITGSKFLTADAISNKIALIFRDCKIAGSGHRLRATFCESVVRDLYLRDRGANGRAWQPNVIIAIARKYLGHMSDEAINSYLNNIASNEYAWAGEPVLVRDSDDAAVIRGLSDALEGTDGRDVARELREWADRMSIPPRAEPNLFNAVKTFENG